MILIRPFFRLMRPHQWVKNGFIFAPLFFGLRFTEPSAWIASIQACIAFMLLSSGIYVFNDLTDRHEDRHHPLKRFRPIASGIITIHQASYLTLFLIFSAWCITFFQLPPACLGVMGIYLLLNIAYTVKLKHIAIIDVIIIASGFVLRVLMGGYAIHVEISPWLILATFLLALFLGFGKRLHEMNITDYLTKRRSLEGYTKPLLDRLIAITCAASLMCYALYTVDLASQSKQTSIVYTIGFVVFGLFRYLQAIYRNHLGGEPESILIRDKLFLSVLVLWLITTLIIVTSAHQPPTF